MDPLLPTRCLRVFSQLFDDLLLEQKVAACLGNSHLIVTKIAVQHILFLAFAPSRALETFFRGSPKGNIILCVMKRRHFLVADTIRTKKSINVLFCVVEVSIQDNFSSNYSAIWPVHCSPNARGRIGRVQMFQASREQKAARTSALQSQ